MTGQQQPVLFPLPDPVPVPPSPEEQLQERIRSALHHDGCGGYFEKGWTGGGRWWGFRCSRCEHEVAVKVGIGPQNDTIAYLRRTRVELPPDYVPVHAHGCANCSEVTWQCREPDCATPIPEEYGEVLLCTDCMSALVARRPGGEST
jgi:hypothetical protein